MPRQHDNLLSEELRFYQENKEDFLHKYTNRYLLIKGSTLVGTFAAKKQAIGQGVRQFGNEPFLIRLSGEDTPTFTVPVLALGLLCQS
ncbi:MAG: hypothetical protein OXE94_00115 [Aestuariivita sp.]|nr:hypothetical protein [Aestuariivita sp.]MCY4202127.1 hypothetical protein [Aestuariivita sp.]MCY4288038.1 hypothetical protein [Aestuariivita sp.]MCY4345806.1 hypothetical protein [Aestuariivita sp.]